MKFDRRISRRSFLAAAGVSADLRKLAKKAGFLLFFTYFCRMTSRREIIEKNKDVLKIKMDNKRAA